MDEAVKMLNEMLEKGMTPSVVPYNVLIAGYCKRGMMEDGMVRPNARCLCRMGRVGEAHQIWESLEELIDGYCKAGKIEDALLLRDSLGSPLIAATLGVLSAARI
ncbi:Pentatricopeptide repeat-containing protein, partial [Mucuna pruriens]